MANKASPFTIRDDGRKQWRHQDGDYYLVTGVCTDGKRFTIQRSTWFTASCINLYRGSKWLVRGGKRYLIERVWN